MHASSTKKWGLWAMMAALMTLFFSPLPGFACLPLPTIQTQLVSEPHHASGEKVHCHQTRVDETQKSHSVRCESSSHESSSSEYSSFHCSSHSSPENPTQPACCCDHGKKVFAVASVVVAQKWSVEMNRVEQPLLVPPVFNSVALQFATANSPPIFVLPLACASRAPPRFAA